MKQSASLGAQSLLTFIHFGLQHFKSLEDKDEVEQTADFPATLEERKGKQRNKQPPPLELTAEECGYAPESLSEVPTWATSQQNIPKRWLAEISQIH